MRSLWPQNALNVQEGKSKREKKKTIKYVSLGGKRTEIQKYAVKVLIQAGSSLPPQIAYVRIQCARRFFVDPVIWHPCIRVTVYEPLPTRYRMLTSFFFPAIFFFSILWICRSSEIQKNNGWKPKKIVDGLAGAYITHVQTIRICLPKNGVDFWSFVRCK